MDGKIATGRKNCGHTPKDWRDTFASQLLTCGQLMAYVSNQLGQADETITSKDYARYCARGYVRPLELGPDEVPADLLVRLRDRERPKTAAAQNTL